MSPCGPSRRRSALSWRLLASSGHHAGMNSEARDVPLFCRVSRVYEFLSIPFKPALGSLELPARPTAIAAIV